MIRTKQRIEAFRMAGVRFFDTMPEGWKVVQFATTAPNGYTWIHNCKNPFTDKDYMTGLLKT